MTTPTAAARAPRRAGLPPWLLIAAGLLGAAWLLLVWQGARWFPAAPPGLFDALDAVAATAGLLLAGYGVYRQGALRLRFVVLFGVVLLGVGAWVASR